MGRNFLGGNKENTPLETDTATLGISNISVTNITDTSVTIGWTTNKESTGQVEYGLTTEYGNVAEDTQYRTTHI